MPARLLQWIAPPADAPRITAESEVRATYRRFRVRQLVLTFIGYAVFYFVRKNIPVALPAMQRQLGVSRANLGLYLTLHDLLYGVSKFANGVLGDRVNARYFMATGLALSALTNVVFGSSTGLYILGAVWMLNGWFQGMGFPPCARVLSHWFSPRERGTKWGLWNTSHQVGAAGILVLAGYAIDRFGSWRAAFLLPAAIALGVSAMLAVMLRDTPGSLGLPPVEQYTGEAPRTAHAPAEPHSPAEYRRVLREKVFGNPYIWLICVGNFFVYVARYAVLNWAPSYLQQARGVSVRGAGWMTAGFEVAGLVGSLAAGVATDRFLRGRRAPVCVAYMLAAIVLIYLFWRVPPGNTVSAAALLAAIGFAVYGPQFLVGVMTADLVPKNAAAAAIGLTGIFGYTSGVISGYGLGWVVDHYGWDGGFRVLLACTVAGTVPFALVWNARPVGEARVDAG